MDIPEDVFATCVERTEGVTASFMRELARRMAQFSLLRDDTSLIIEADMRNAFEDLLGSGDFGAAVPGKQWGDFRKQ